jgi:hypothetical protein
MATTPDPIRRTLIIFGSIGMAIYLFFILTSGLPGIHNLNFSEISVYLLFLVFAIAYFSLWKSLTVSGILFTLFFILQLILVIYVWEDGGLTLLLGIPVLFFGIVVTLFGLNRYNKKGFVNDAQGSNIEKK